MYSSCILENGEIEIIDVNNEDKLQHSIMPSLLFYLKAFLSY